MQTVEYYNNITDKQNSINQSAIMSLMIIAKLNHKSVNPQNLKHQFLSSSNQFGTHEMLLAAKHIGLKAKKIEAQLSRLQNLHLPAIARDKQGKFFILAKADNQEALIHYHNQAPTKITLAELDELWNNTLILFTALDTEGAAKKFDFTWFIPVIIKYRKILLEILCISFILQIFALMMPLFFQVIMDKVLVHRGLQTLDVICLGLIILIFFEVVLSTLRSYIFSHTTTRIDAELGTSLFRHLLALPISYFEARKVGESVARIRELENIRNFLTSNSVSLLIDLLFACSFIGIMFYYSVTLTFIVIASLPLYAILSIVITPILRKQLDEQFSKGAKNQSFLVEAIHNIQTVKASSLEPRFMQNWDQQLAAYLSSSFKTAQTGNIANHSVQLISKIVTLVIMYFGAKQVMNQDMSLGQLIAFNMFASQVAQPIMRIAQLWTDFQQVGISMKRLADILDMPSELQNQQHALILPNVKGKITFENICFAYDKKSVLHNINLDIAPGQTIGIVGRSGSGKSTITKLLQGLYLPQSGKIFVDDINIHGIDPSSWRRQIGVVLQENELFNMTVGQNIAIACPQASTENIVKASILAGAHEFISNLPNGYDTMIGENGTGLSGGQKQRVAIARALLHNPQILIFDEATSALDYESEHIIQQNMANICKNRTVIIIAHRLSAVKHAHKIVVMDEGYVKEIGSHTELINLKGIYAHLHKLQST